MIINSSTAGFLFLIAVLGVATFWGFRPAAALSVAAMLCYNYFFLAPVGRFTIADPDNWIALTAFLITALVASHLSDRVQREAAEARRRQLETEQLYALSRAILLADASKPIGPQAAQNIAQIFQSPSITVFDAKSDKIFRGGGSEVAGIEQRLREVVRLGSHQRLEAFEQTDDLLSELSLRVLQDWKRGAVPATAADFFRQSANNFGNVLVDLAANLPGPGATSLPGSLAIP